jgi:hypothetical protein
MSSLNEGRRWLIAVGALGIISFAFAQGGGPIRQIIAGSGLLGGGTGPVVTLAVDPSSVPAGPAGPMGPPGPIGPAGSIAGTQVRKFEFHELLPEDTFSNPLGEPVVV